VQNRTIISSDAGLHINAGHRQWSSQVVVTSRGRSGAPKIGRTTSLSGLKAHSAVGHTNHLLAANVQFLTELVIVEVPAPQLRRVPQSGLYDVPLLRFGKAAS